MRQAFRFAEELYVELNFEHFRTVKKEVRKCQVERLEIGSWQSAMAGTYCDTTRVQDGRLSASGCFWWP